jgi:hypothetical protein
MKYIDYIRSKPCLISEDCDGDVVAHHVRIDQNAGLTMKPNDLYCVPLCVKHHLEWHRRGNHGMVCEYLVRSNRDESAHWIYKQIMGYICGYERQNNG